MFRHSHANFIIRLVGIITLVTMMSRVGVVSAFLSHSRSQFPRGTSTSSIHQQLLHPTTHLPSSFVRGTTTRHFASVTGSVYQVDDETAPSVVLFTKEGCTLCDKVKDVMSELRESHPHSLSQMDITDPEHTEWFDKYKYDIPVLHVNGQYWTKHRLTADEVIKAFASVQEGTFQSPRGEPNAAEMERKYG